MSKKTQLIILVCVAVIFFAAGYYYSSSVKVPAGKNTFQAGWDAAKKRLADSGFTSPMGNFEIKNISGQVTAVKNNTITLKIRPLEPLADSNLDERIIQIDNNTKIYILTQKDQAEYQSEIVEFNKKMQEQAKNSPQPGQTPVAPASAIRPPELFVKKQAGLADIKVGININVVAADKNIKNIKQFSVVEINIQPALVTTPTTAAPLKTPAAATPPTSIQPVK